MKVSGLKEAISCIKPGSKVAFGGDALHRVPVAAVREIIEQKKELGLITAAGSLEADALCAAGLAKHITFAYVGYENFGTARFFRQAIEHKTAQICAHTGSSLSTGLRAAALGLSFMPLPPTDDWPEHIDHRWQPVRDPYNGQTYPAIPALAPDWSIIHVQQADILGNARIYGSKFEDLLLAKAARHVLVTCEELLPAYAFADQPETVDISGSIVDSVVYAPRGAWPTACYEHYSADENKIKEIITLQRPVELLAWLNNLPPINDRSPVLETPLAKEHLQGTGANKVV